MSLYPHHKPRGIRKHWEHCSVEERSAAQVLRQRGVPKDWGDPIDAVAWFDEDGDGELKIMVADYANGRRVEYRRRARDYTVKFSSREVQQ